MTVQFVILRWFALLAVAFGAAQGSGSAQATAGVPSAQDSALESDEPRGETLRVLSFNVRTWTRDRDSRSEVFWRTRMAAMERMIEELDPDVLCFQEMLFPATTYVPDGYKRVGVVNISHPIFIRKSLEATDSDTAVRWSACTVNGVRIINVHSSWDSEITARTVEQVNAQLTGCDVACGDWNVRLASLQNAGLEMLSARALLDVPEDEDTFANFTRPQESHGPIDHFFVRGLTPVSYQLIKDSYGCLKMSDHYPLLLDIQKESGR